MARTKRKAVTPEAWKTASHPYAAATYMVVGVIWLVVMGLIWFSERDDVRGLFVPVSNWKPTSGIVMSSTLIYQEGSRGVGQFLAEIRYVYWIESKKYEGNRIGFGTPLSKRTKEAANKLVAKYPQRSPVTVYYLEQNPSISALEPENKSYGSLIMLILLTLPGPTLIISGIVYRQSEQTRLRYLFKGGK